MRESETTCGSCGQPNCACAPTAVATRPFQLLERPARLAGSSDIEPPRAALIREYKGPTVADFDRVGDLREWLPAPDVAVRGGTHGEVGDARTAASRASGGRVLAGPGSTATTQLALHGWRLAVLLLASAVGAWIWFWS